MEGPGGEKMGTRALGMQPVRVAVDPVPFFAVDLFSNELTASAALAASGHLQLLWGLLPPQSTRLCVQISTRTERCCSD